jgi:hypothetical protein
MLTPLEEIVKEHKTIYKHRYIYSVTVFFRHIHQQVEHTRRFCTEGG